MIPIPDKLKDSSLALVGTALPAGGLAISLSTVETALRITALIVTIISGAVATYFCIRKNR
jgi:hypothetical protein